MTHLSLFTGIGGLDLAAEWAGFETVGQCEWADYPTKVLEKHWPDVARWRDVRDLTAKAFREKTGVKRPTVVSGGFPCQPHSLAGKRLASDDGRDLWRELFRVFCETGARWLVAENVRGLLSSEHGRFFGRILRDLAECGCNAWWYCFPAWAAGAKYVGERVCLIAASDSERRICLDASTKRTPDGKYLEMLGQWQARQNGLLLYPARDESTRGSKIKRNDDGISPGLDALKAYGNSVNPYQFYPIFAVIAEVENQARADQEEDGHA